jgi:hypothetical protein
MAGTMDIKIWTQVNFNFGDIFATLYFHVIVSCMFLFSFMEAYQTIAFEAKVQL